MELNQLTGLSTSVTNKINDAAITKAQEQLEEETTGSAVAEKTDTYSSKKTEAKVTYKMDSKTVAQMKSESNFRMQAFQSMVQKMATKQGMKGQMANGNLKNFYKNLTVDPATKAKAQADIAEDGYWGVSQTSERILDFAKALSGGDPSKIESLRNAVEKGFKKAAKAWGDELPGISQQTYEAVMKGFDDWAKGNEIDDDTIEA